MPCHGQGPEHCCWVGATCEFLTSTPERRFACSLFIELGSWEAVHADLRYRQAPIGRYFASRYPGFGCGDFPQNIPAVMDDPHAGKCCWGER